MRGTLAKQLRIIARRTSTFTQYFQLPSGQVMCRGYRADVRRMKRDWAEARRSGTLREAMREVRR